MAKQSNDIKLAIFNLGTWERDCEKRESKITPPAPSADTPEFRPNTFGAKIELGGIVAQLGGWIANAFSSLFPPSAGQQNPANAIKTDMDTKAPGFQGSVLVHLWAKGETTACDPTTRKLKLNWVWFADITITGKANTGVLAAGGFASFRLGPFNGGSQDCDCDPATSLLPNFNPREVFGGELALVSPIPSSFAPGLAMIYYPQPALSPSPASASLGAPMKSFVAVQPTTPTNRRKRRKPTA